MSSMPPLPPDSPGVWQRHVESLRGAPTADFVNRQNNWSPPVYDSYEVVMQRIQAEEEAAIRAAYALNGGQPRPGRGRWEE